MENKKGWIAFVCIYLFLHVFNYLHPMNFGDDYIYSFIWQGNPMSIPLTSDATRIASFRDIFVSQWLHYFTWGGRTVAHLLVQFFLWAGKDTFNFFNALMGTLLVAEIYICIYKGNSGLNFAPKTVSWIFFLLWTFVPAFSSVFFWLTGSCNYLWATSFLISFAIPYIDKYYRMEQNLVKYNTFYSVLMFFCGIFAGWTNENSVCLVLVVLLLLIYMSWKIDNVEKWMISGAIGLFIGYALLMLAPGNVVRLQTDHDLLWLQASSLKANFRMLATVLTFQLFLWHFILKSLFLLRKSKSCEAVINQDILFVKTICFIAFVSSAMMVLSPVFPARSAFFGTVLLIIAAGVLMRLQKENGIEFINAGVKKFLLYLGTSFFIVSSLVSLKAYYSIHLHMQEIVNAAQELALNKNNNEEILTIHSFRKVSNLEDLLSGFHIPEYNLEEDENDWKNVDFARYYGIKGIRMIRGDIEDKKENRQETVKITSESNLLVPRSR